MRELPDLKIDLEKFMADVKEFKEHTVLYKLSPAKHTYVEYFKENVKSKFSAYVKNLEEQDAERALYSVHYGVSPRREGCLA